MRLSLRLLPFLCVLGALSACADAPQHTATIKGVATLFTDMTPLPGVTVVSGTSKATVTSGADGTFEITGVRAGSQVTLTAQAEGYASSSKLVAVDGNTQSTVAFYMTPTQVYHIDLPAAGQAPARVGSGNPNVGTVALSIPASSLVTADGTIATGAVDVNLAYWPADAGRIYGPFPLLAQDPNDANKTADLMTYGMADIKVLQNGNELSVAPGQHVELTFGIAAPWRNYIAAVIDSNYNIPHLYSGDPNKGLWVDEGSLEDGRLTFDPNTVSFTGTLPHMSAWNLDSLNMNVGGCVTGQVLEEDGKTPMANAKVRVFFLDVDEIADYIATTDANGNYCITAGTNGGLGSDGYQSNYYISSADDINASNMCNPMPQWCQNRPEGIGPEIYDQVNNWVSHCALRNEDICADIHNGAISGRQNGSGVNEYCSPPTYSPCNVNSSEGDLKANCSYVEVGASEPVRYAYTDSCSPATPLVQIDACSFCPGTPLPSTCQGQGTKTPNTPFNVTPQYGGCGVLKTVVFKKGVVTPDPPAVGSVSKPLCDPSVPTTKLLGSECTPGVDTCCPLSANLSCQDHLCVPPQDG